MKNFEAQDGKKFFEEKICNLGNNFENISLESFNCILQFFLLVNDNLGLISVIYPSQQKKTNVTGIFLNKILLENDIPDIKIKARPEKLDGIEIFWKIVQEATENDVIEKSRDFLSKVYTQFSEEIESDISNIRVNFIEAYLNKLSTILSGQMKNKSEKLSRMIKLMRDMIDESERNGTGGLKSHSALLKGELIEVIIRNNLTSGKTIPKRMEVNVNSNVTIWELKAEIGKYIESSPECMKLAFGTKEIKDTDHGKTIGEIIQKRRGCITITKKNMDDVKKVPLVNEENQLTPAAKYAFGSIFNKFATNGKMTREEGAAFIMGTTGEKGVTADDGRITMLFSTEHKDSNGLLLEDGFNEFYRKCVVEGREDTVWENIHTHGFRNDLKKLNEVVEKKVDPSSLPRYLLSKNPKSFDLLFSIMGNKDTSEELTWELISRLATNEVMYNNLLSFETVADKEGKVMWEKLIDKHSTLKLLYCLQVLESFLVEDSEIAVKRKKWKEDFIEKGGFTYLLGIILNQKPEDGICFNVGANLGNFEKECLSYLGKILYSFIKVSAYSLDETLLANVTKAQASYKKHLTVAVQEEEKEETEQTATYKKKTDEGQKEKAKEPVFDVSELFKAKPSTILFLVSHEKKQKRESTENIKIKDTEMTKKQSDFILSTVKDTDIMSRQFEILAKELQKEDLNNSDAKVIRSALQLLSICLLANPAAFSKLISMSKEGINLDKIIILGLLCEKFPEIREEFMDVFFFLGYVLKSYPTEMNVLHYALSILLTNMPSKRSPGSKECGEYFHLTCKLIDIYYESKSGNIFDPKDILAKLVDMLRDHRTSETRNSNTADKLLIGIINTIRKILSHEKALKEIISIKEGLLREVFFECLFSGNSIDEGTRIKFLRSESQEGTILDSQKCKSSESRSAAYKLLATMCQASQVCQSYLLKECMEPLCRSIKPHEGWDYVPFSESRSKYGYAGLHNLGCICYMNSMIQQFFMVPTFRYELIAADDKRAPKCEKPGDVDDNVLHQLQRIFANLELTERQDYNPRSFCFSFKGQDGKPTNTSIQQDSQEFLNVVFDRIEYMLKPTPQKYLLQSVFGGKTCSQMICKGGCGSMRKSYEDFYNLSLGVKGNRDLSDALNKYITGDTISDYFCDKCKKKVDVVKRTSLHELPNVLIVHLQRIIFNFDTMMNEKINSRLEFPTEFDMEPYTIEGIEKREANATSGEKAEDQWHGKGEDYYKYKLCGVVVHTGSADAGHYYSYINTNRKSNYLLLSIYIEPHAKQEGNDVWLEFNDSHIRSFE